MCDLSDPRITEAYNAIIEEEPTDWLLLGYTSRDVISLYAKGTEGLGEFRNHLGDEVLYGFLRVDDRYLLVTYVPDQVSGVRRARALVHSRSVANILKVNHAQITASSLSDLSDANVRTRLKLGENQVPNRSRPSSMSERKRASLSSRRRSSQSQSQSAAPPSPTDPSPMLPSDVVTAEPDEFQEASEELPSSEDVQSHQINRNASEDGQPIEPVVSEEQRQQEERDRARKAAEEKLMAEETARLQAQAEAAAKAKAEEEARRRAEEEAKKQKAEEERIEREQKAALLRKIEEAEKNKDIILAGFASVQPNDSPFWRRRYFIIRGKNLMLYRDEQDKTPIIVIDLNNVTSLSAIDEERDTFVPNAFVLDTHSEGSFQVFADDKKDADTIFTALQTVVKAN
ncbi:uncharacterized protein BYT42DRAFT_585222 [Radiomyces spectabilis]|uniref:uncharacterized protein n=1 Tax=Radiomyces spectabilis TaxID=64574 RepID=UPI00221F081B|nr:uncharacterized protein BYT42DRAFT_585222 [Radiomyces spectabilis]KAI8369648.1 hypothetical protein BYT42DRAFT_585222 [Radiomyces spectabilis]